MPDGEPITREASRKTSVIERTNSPQVSFSMLQRRFLEGVDTFKAAFQMLPPTKSIEPEKAALQHQQKVLAELTQNTEVQLAALHKESPTTGNSTTEADLQRLSDEQAEGARWLSLLSPEEDARRLDRLRQWKHTQEKYSIQYETFKDGYLSLTPTEREAFLAWNQSQTYVPPKSVPTVSISKETVPTKLWPVDMYAKLLATAIRESTSFLPKLTNHSKERTLLSIRGREIQVGAYGIQVGESQKVYRRRADLLEEFGQDTPYVVNPILWELALQNGNLSSNTIKEAETLMPVTFSMSAKDNLAAFFAEGASGKMVRMDGIDMIDSKTVQQIINTVRLYGDKLIKRFSSQALTVVPVVQEDKVTLTFSDSKGATWTINSFLYDSEGDVQHPTKRYFDNLIRLSTASVDFRLTPEVREIGLEEELSAIQAELRIFYDKEVDPQSKSARRQVEKLEGNYRRKGLRLLRKFPKYFSIGESNEPLGQTELEKLRRFSDYARQYYIQKVRALGFDPDYIKSMSYHLTPKGRYSQGHTIDEDYVDTKSPGGFSKDGLSFIWSGADRKIRSIYATLAHEFSHTTCLDTTYVISKSKVKKVGDLPGMFEEGLAEWDALDLIHTLPEALASELEINPQHYDASRTSDTEVLFVRKIAGLLGYYDAKSRSAEVNLSEEDLISRGREILERLRYSEEVNKHTSLRELCDKIDGFSFNSIIGQLIYLGGHPAPEKTRSLFKSLNHAEEVIGKLFI